MGKEDQSARIPPPAEQKSAAEWVAAGSAAVAAGTQAWQALQGNKKPKDK